MGIVGWLFSKILVLPEYFSFSHTGVVTMDVG